MIASMQLTEKTYLPDAKYKKLTGSIKAHS